MIFTNQEKTVVADFIFSMETDVLIKSDAEKVINMFKLKGVDVSNVGLNAYQVFMLIKQHFDVLERRELMKLYTSGKL